MKYEIYQYNKMIDIKEQLYKLEEIMLKLENAEIQGKNH